MTSLQRFLATLSTIVFLAGFAAHTTSADTSHVRIVRLSFVEGDVRFTRDVKGDPLADADHSWEAAALNLPIRQGYALATDNGRAVVEFENGAMAFLSENTVLEFYDLSSEDGGFTTRLILRQGSAEFYANPRSGDYFSVTGGDFSAQAESRTTFRMSNFDDGSNVNVLRGKLTALSKGKSTQLRKNQSLSMKAGDLESLSVEAAAPTDDFDQWVSGRIENFNAATDSGAQYTNSYNYTSGFGDLYTYGAWFPVAGYGNCWRPYGVGLGWSPFDYGSWYYDGAFGWSFLGGQPWGWLPYHFGGWLFRPGVGWVWSPSGSFGGGGVGRWRPVTGVWMRSTGGAVGIVPAHPLDAKGKTPLNLSVGLFTVTPRGVSSAIPAESNDRWKIEKNPSRNIMQNQLAAAAAPSHVARTMASSTAGAPAAASAVQASPEKNRTANSSNQVPAISARSKGREALGVPSATTGARTFVPARTAVAPPSVPRSVTSERSVNESAGSGGGSRGASGSAAGSSRASSPASSTVSSPASSGRGPSPSPSSGGGGGRPH
jgi:hypothetical protein